VGIKKPGTDKQRERVLTTEKTKKVLDALNKERPIIAGFLSACSAHRLKTGRASRRQVERGQSREEAPHVP
jgi:hypothetical protein